MAERKELLKESIAKLLSLNVSDSEILANLKDVGLSDSEAWSFLEETKKDKAIARRASIAGGSRDFSKTDETSSALSEEEIEGAIEESAAEEKPNSFSGKMSFSSEKEKQQSEARSDVMELWEKGIMATVNSKLSEMESLKKDIEGVIDKKLQRGLAKEVAKIEMVFESQRGLGASRINEALESKSKEVADLIDQKILQLNVSNELGKGLFSKLESQRRNNEKVLSEMNSKLAELSKLKDRLSGEINSEFEKSKHRVDIFLGESEGKRKETVERINRSLELEAKIVEGLMNDAKQKIDSLALKKSNELESSLVARFDAEKAELDKKTKSLEEMKEKIDSYISKKSAAFEKDMQAKFDSEKADLAKKIAELEEIEKKIDIETIRTTMEELGAFRKQFAAQIKKNVESFNDAKKELTDLIQQREALIDKQLEILKLKIKEFEAFEEEFAAQVGMKIDKASEAKKPKKAKA